ncbi:mammalian uncoordinated homology 13 protein [Tanacetum coccineum]
MLVLILYASLFSDTLLNSYWFLMFPVLLFYPDHRSPTNDSQYQLSIPTHLALLPDLIVGLDRCLQYYTSKAKSGCGSRNTFIPAMLPLTRCAAETKFHGVLGKKRNLPIYKEEILRRVTLETYGSSAKSRLPLPATTGQWSPSDPNTLLRVLCCRNDDAASKFLNKNYNLPKKL